jgi:RNA polymerase sigma-B factor
MVGCTATLHRRVRETQEQARSDRDTATGRLLAAYRDNGDARARERLVELYMPLVEMLAHRHGMPGAERDDLVQAGSIGLLNAIERFDPERGEEFAAFAVPTIAGEIKRHIRDRTDTVRLPRQLQEAGVRLPRTRDELTARLGRQPSQSELAGQLGVTTEDLARLENGSAGQAHENAAEWDGSEIDASEARLLLADAFRTLDDTDRRIVYLRFVRERSRREVADELGMSQSALARRTSAALAKLRRELEGRAFERGAQSPARAPTIAAAPVPAIAAAAAEGAPGDRPAAVPADRPAAAGGAPGDRPAAAGGAPAEPGPAPTAATPAEPPAPDTKTRHSGRLMLRMPQSLHAELAQAAEREEVSLNQFITNTLSAAMARNPDGERPQAPPPRWLPAAIVTNIVVVAIAGVIAVVLLLVAWQQGW